LSTFARVVFPRWTICGTKRGCFKREPDSIGLVRKDSRRGGVKGNQGNTKGKSVRKDEEKCGETVKSG